MDSCLPRRLQQSLAGDYLGGPAAGQEVDRMEFFLILHHFPWISGILVLEVVHRLLSLPALYFSFPLLPTTFKIGIYRPDMAKYLLITHQSQCFCNDVLTGIFGE
jgi:hypothetical protein